MRVAGVALGVLYFTYREIIKRDIFPKLKQWQGFAVICLITVLVFVVAMTALLHRGSESMLPGELPASAHFQFDSREGIFCEERNIDYNAAPHYFDILQVGLAQCAGGKKEGSRSYAIRPMDQPPTSWIPSRRRGFRHCGPSNFYSVAPKVVEAVRREFETNKDKAPCSVTVSLDRVLFISYTDMRNRSNEVAFLQTYNRNGKGALDMRQIDAGNAPRSNSMDSINQVDGNGIGTSGVVRIYDDFKPFLFEGSVPSSSGS